MRYKFPDAPEQSGRILLHTASLAAAGFAVPATAKDGVIELQPGQPVNLTFPRTN